MNEEFDKALDEASKVELAESQGRFHFGASQAGSYCSREGWYTYRACGSEEFDGRMLRLFDRGHHEEFRVSRWLRSMGIEVQDYAERLMHYDGVEGLMPYKSVPWDQDISEEFYDDVSADAPHVQIATELGYGPKQWSFSVDIDGDIEPKLTPEGLPDYPPKGTGHYEGSGDGRVRGLEVWYPELEGEGWGLYENKTHGKTFADLAKKGVKVSKREHWLQMQQYMHFFGFKWGLYIGVCKQTDAIYHEIVWYDEATARQLADRAMSIIRTSNVPPRVTEDPSKFCCRFCNHREACHYHAPVSKDCRSCVFVTPTTGGQWTCNKHSAVVPKEFITTGCDDWVGVE